MKLPANVKDKGIKFKVIAQEAIEWYVNHERKNLRNFKSRMALIVETFGERVADEIKPSEIDGWLGKHAWKPATKNRYKNVFGKTYKIALADGRVTGNPARLVEQRAENNARIRYLLAEEESRLREVIARRFPLHLPSFDIALNTGMRKQEQFSLEWLQVSFSSRRIHLTMTKNGSTREIPMNRTCQQSFEVLQALGRQSAEVAAAVNDVKSAPAWKPHRELAHPGGRHRNCSRCLTVRTSRENATMPSWLYSSAAGAADGAGPRGYAAPPPSAKTAGGWSTTPAR
jgi:hypothetical protein